MRSKKRHLLIPDCQIKPGVPTDHLLALGNYILDRKPDVIVNIGDFADMHGLSYYDKGKLSGKAQNIKEDVDAAAHAMDVLLEPMRAYNRHAALGHRSRYKPRMVMCLGNHENRINRYIDNNPELEGYVSTDDLPYDDWEVHPFLEAVEIDEILYSHFFPRNAQGRIVQTNRGAPNARLQVTREMQSATAGHLQGVDYYCHQTGTRRYHGIIAGSFYQHEEAYLGPQGTAYWRGVVVKNQVEAGGYDPMFVSLDYLMDEWR
jgi:hypothetical protein